MNHENWTVITENEAWKLCREGQREVITPPYAGYMRVLYDGSKLRCIRDKVTSKTRFELLLPAAVTK